MGTFPYIQRDKQTLIRASINLVKDKTSHQHPEHPRTAELLRVINLGWFLV